MNPCHACRLRSSSSHERSIEPICGVISWATEGANALAHLLRFLHLYLKGSGTLIDLLQLCEMTVQNSDDLGELNEDVMSVITKW